MNTDNHVPTCAGFDPSPRPVAVRLPRGTCDAHFHLFGPYQRYPLQPARGYTPPEASLADYRRLCVAIGIERAVLVQPSVYGTDLTLMLAVLRDNAWLRGVAVVEEDVSDEALTELHAAGVRGVRINYALGARIPLSSAHALGARVHARGWHVEVLVDLAQEPRFYDQWVSFPGTLVVAHMGQMPVSHGIDAPGFQGLLRLLREGKAHVKLSGVNRVTAQPYPHDDVLVYVQTLVAANRERLVWGSDWPHPLVNPVPNDGDLANLIPRWLASDDLREQVLVANPARLYDFH